MTLRQVVKVCPCAICGAVKRQLASIESRGDAASTLSRCCGSHDDRTLDVSRSGTAPRAQRTHSELALVFRRVGKTPEWNPNNLKPHKSFQISASLVPLTHNRGEDYGKKFSSI